jgi:hypothetical protein
LHQADRFLLKFLRKPSLLFHRVPHCSQGTLHFSEASPVAAENAAIHRVAEAQHALDAATHDVELYRVNILDNTLVASRDRPIEYRVANTGEVLPAGGKVFTMLDASYVYMDMYLILLLTQTVRGDPMHAIDVMTSEVISVDENETVPRCPPPAQAQINWRGRGRIAVSPGVEECFVDPHQSGCSRRG